MKVLLTGFEPFEGNQINPSQQVVEALNAEFFQNVELFQTILPVDSALAPMILLQAMHTHQPDAILSFGLASGRSRVSLERVAINLMDFRIPDNSGVQITDQPIIKGGPAAYFTTLPVRSLLGSLLDAGIPTEISLTAGGYLCNLVFYTMMHEIAVKKWQIPAGFIHLPTLPEMASKSDKALPSLNLDLDIKAARLLITHLSQK